MSTSKRSRLEVTLFCKICLVEIVGSTRRSVKSAVPYLSFIPSFLPCHLFLSFEIGALK